MSLIHIDRLMTSLDHGSDSDETRGPLPSPPLGLLSKGFVFRQYRVSTLCVGTEQLILHQSVKLTVMGMMFERRP